MADGSGAPALAAVDRGALGRYLSELTGLHGSPEVSVLSGGSSNITYLVRIGDRELVVRRRPLGTTAPRAHDMSREYTVLAALGPTGAPVPRVHAFCPDEALVGAPCYVMDRVAGVVLHEPADAAGLDARQATDCSRAVVETLVGLHATDVEAAGLGALGRPDGFVARRLEGWLRQWDAVEHRDLPAVPEIGADLQRRLPPEAGSTLVHGDFRLGNLMLTLEPAVSVVAVLDWEMSTLGDPLTDLAHLAVYWEPTAGRVTHPSQLIAGAPGFLSATELAEAYSAATGRSLDHLDFYLAFEHWRAAIIKEGIYMRGRDAGGADARRAEEIGGSVPVHLEEAHDILLGTRSTSRSA